jgi:ribosomal protein S8
MIKENKYDFSFTTSSLRLNEMLTVAKAKIEDKELDFINDLGGGKYATGRKMFSEFNKRLSFMTAKQIEVLLDGDLPTQKQIAFVSVCKTYGFIRDFVIEVVREKYLVYDYQITEGDYISFYRRKLDLHDEMVTLTELTQKKIKQVTFKILEQAGFIDTIKSRNIQPQIIDLKLMNAIVQDNPNWLKVLLVSDMDIERTQN